MDRRIIGSYEGVERGPLFICIGAMHGNEPAGIRALELLFKMLEVEPITNPDFSYKGKFVGLVGNLQACETKQRFLKHDMNRQFKPEIIERLKQEDPSTLIAEDKELYELIKTIEDLIAAYQPTKLYLLDLHTTSSSGGIFTITTDDPESIEIATHLHAPVVKGFLQGIQGTTLHYFNTENMGIPTVALTFESGQHEEDLAVNRAIAVMTNFMRIIGSVEEEDVAHQHNEILIEYSRDLPKVSQLIHRHGIEPSDQFKMQPNFENFQSVQHGQIIAHDKSGPIIVQEDCMILMPLYQNQGEEGFFLVKDIIEL